MIRSLQLSRLGRPEPARLTKRLVWRDCRYGGADGRTTLLSPISSGSRSQISSRTFSSSRRYATVLHAEGVSGDVNSTLPPSMTGTPGASSSSSRTVLVRPPSKESVDEDEELVPEAEARFVISTRAAERLRSLAQREGNPNVAVRIAVESGGCHGYQTKIELTDLAEGDGDYHFALPTIAPSNVLIDPVSLSLLSGATLDYATELIGSTFRVTDNPHAAGGCGCGVSWEAKA